MRLSTRTLYGIRLMFQLGTHHNQGPLQLREVCERENISEKYMGQIIMLLKAQGLVTSVRGAQGGYMLATEPRKLNLYDVIECLEGEILPVPDLPEASGCTEDSECAVNEVWEKLNLAVFKTLSSMTLDDILQSHAKMQKLVDYTI